MRLGKNFQRMVPIYRHFAKPWESCLDFSDAMLEQMYKSETFGEGRTSADNGFAHGKKWMDVTVAMWLEDLGRTLWPSELYADPAFPHWWLDKVLPAKV